MSIMNPHWFFQELYPVDRKCFIQKMGSHFGEITSYAHFAISKSIFFIGNLAALRPTLGHYREVTVAILVTTLVVF